MTFMMTNRVIHGHNFVDYVKTYSKIFKRICLMPKAAKIRSSDNKIKINSEIGKEKSRDTPFSLQKSVNRIDFGVNVSEEFENSFTNMPIQMWNRKVFEFVAS